MDYVVYVVIRHNDITNYFCKNKVTISVDGNYPASLTYMKRSFKLSKRYYSADNAANSNVPSNRCDGGNAATIPELPLLDDPPFIEIDTDGFDPYNSGSFDSTKYGEN